MEVYLGVCSVSVSQRRCGGVLFLEFFISLYCANKIGFISALLISPYLSKSNIQWEKKASGDLSK